MNNSPIFALVCTGGGAHGAYQVGVLKYIHEKFCRGSHSPFQIFTGSSCGSLNTTFFAAESHDAFKKRLVLEELWMQFHIPGYHRHLLKSFVASLYHHWRGHDAGQSTWSILSPEPMRKIVEKGFSRKNLDFSLKSGSTLGVSIAATELLSGRTCWFSEGPLAKAWNLFHSVGILDSIIGRHLEASCSVPIFLPPVKIGERFYLDGSISMERPLSPAIHMGATHILSIASDHPIPDHLPHYPQNFRPHLTDPIRMLLTRLSCDAIFGEAVQIRMLNRFYQALSRKHKKADADSLMPLFHEESRPSHYHNVKVCIIHPSKRIRPVPSVSNDETIHQGRQKKTRFMFHEKFIRELITMGYEDGKARHDEIKDFFTLKGGSKTSWFRFKSK